jgi:anti-sigma-K factor RskA
MMMHTDVAELADLYVLDSLPTDLAEAVEEHLAVCPECQATVDRAWEVAQLLRVGVPPVDPSPSLRNRLMAVVNAEAREHVPAQVSRVDPERQPARGGSGMLGTLRWAASAAFVPLILAGWLVYQIFGMQQQMRTTELQLAQTTHTAQDASEIFAKALQRGGNMVRVEGAEGAPAASGMLYYVGEESQGVLVVSGLPQLPRDRVYQCWFMSGERRMSGGTFYIEEEDGRALLVVRSPMALESLDGLRVTVEPRGGSGEPRGSPYLWARLKGT